jgi:phenylalanyl-tRNA synthetase beta chain
MRISFDWLKEFVDIDCSVEEFSEAITMTGTKVETIEFVGDKIKNISLCRVIEIKKHPNADKLVVVKVDVGNNNILQIVTGAKNLFVDAIVPVALDNSCLYDGTKIKKSKLRGERSEGMLCSIQELGGNQIIYPEAPDGIYIFDSKQFENKELKLGDDVCNYLKLRDVIIDLEITSNRTDCQSVVGVAREIAATLNKKLRYPNIEEKNIFAQSKVNIILETNLCRNYFAQLIEDIKIAPSPSWMKHRLISSGINPVNNIVDVTNYVMLETGQPLHAFDADKVFNKEIIVRLARKEKILCLDQIEREVDKAIVVCDAEKILAIAGIIGGESSKITHETKNIILESASFDSESIKRSSNLLNISTDASVRYARCIDENLTEFAIRRAIYLIKKITKAKIDSSTQSCFLSKKVTRKIILDVEKINNILGTHISKSDMISILVKLEFGFENKDADIVIVPSFRDDICTTVDLAEEIARFYGYNKIEYTLPDVRSVGKRDSIQKVNNKIKQIMKSCGAYEIKKFSFESKKAFERSLVKTENVIEIMNPLGEEFSVMRADTLNSMLETISYNLNNKNENVLLFELGKIYLEIKNKTGLPTEKNVLTIGAYGSTEFFVMKGIVENLFDNLNLHDYTFTKLSDAAFLHPFRAAEIVLCGKKVGYLGEIHPNVMKNYKIKTKTYVATLNVEEIYDRIPKSVKLKPLPKFPAVYRDINLLMNKDINSGDIIDVMYKCCNNILEHVMLFDVYTGPQISDNKKSLSYKLTFRSNDRTMTEEEVNDIIKTILMEVNNVYGAVLRY